MSNKFISTLSKLMWDSDLLGIRFLLAIAEFFWAIMLVWPGDSFTRLTYTHMGSVMPEEAWAFLFLITGIFQITIILQNDLHSRFARYFAGFNCTLWLFVVTGLLLALFPPPAAIAGDIALTLGSIWIWIRPYILAEGYRRAYGKFFNTQTL